MIADEKDYVLGLWYVATAEQDWMAGVTRKPGATDWTITYRFRYYATGPGDPFDERDRKSWYSGTATGPEAVVVAGMDQVAGELANMLGAAVEVREYLEVRGTARKLIEILSTRPWAHVVQGPV